MCGLAGVFGSLGSDRVHEALEEILQLQSHRGPDATGIWYDRIHGVDIAMGLSRLKILDLSDAANQPMMSPDGRFVLVYNGEVYNYLELRGELASAGAIFRTGGDTEVVLQALIWWGTAAFARFNGMWSLALLDRATGDIMLSRDRFGIKPLYTYAGEHALFISSEIKGILKASRERFQTNAEVANTFLCQNLLCTNGNTFFAGIKEFPAGHWAKIPVNQIGAKRLNPVRYWRVPTSPSSESSEKELIELVRETFVEAVKIRLRSDVPVGVLLSGGIDSSAIASAIHHLGPSRDDVKLLSAVAGTGSDEQYFIDIAADHLKRSVEKVVLNYSSSTALSLITEVSWFNDEPIHNFSTVAHYLLMMRAKELGITVLLSGQGADEILCGYRKYLGFYMQELLTSGKWSAAAQVMKGFLLRRTIISQISYQETKRYLPRWSRLPEIDIRGPALLGVNYRIPVGLDGGRVIDRQVIDIERLSIPALVHYEDRMSMARAREVRLPFLDYRLVELLVPLPMEYKLRDGWTKWIFRRAMETLMPKEIAWRKDKQPFIVPQNAWFRCELRENVLALLGEDWVTERLGLVNRGKFRTRYDAYLQQGNRNGRLSFKDIFAPIALELWARRFESYLSA